MSSKSDEEKEMPQTNNDSLEPFNRVMDKVFNFLDKSVKDHLVFVYQLRKFMTNESDKIEGEIITLSFYISLGLLFVAIGLNYTEVDTILSPWSFAISFLVFTLFKFKHVIRRNKNESGES